MTQLLIEEGIIFRERFFAKLEEFQAQYQVKNLDCRYQISVLSIVPPTRRQKFTAKRWPS